MAAVTLTADDLAPFAEIPLPKALLMIDDAIAMAARVAPCILEDTFTYEAAARAILRGAVLRWNDAGSGALQSETVGNYAYTSDNRQQRRGMFWPTEIEQLQSLCSSGEQSGAFAVDTVGLTAGGHADICTLNFGGLYCSCGYVLTMNLPLYENLA